MTKATNHFQASVGPAASLTSDVTDQFAKADSAGVRYVQQQQQQQPGRPDAHIVARQARLQRG